MIGWRALAIAGKAKHLGLYGFGAAAHIVAQIAQWQGRPVYAVTRPGDLPTQRFARGLGVAWAGGSDELSPEPLDAAIFFAPAGELVFLGMAPAMGIVTTTTAYPLSQANQALADHRAGRFEGAAVLIP